MMRAARYYGKEDIRIEQVPESPCGPHQIKVRQPPISYVKACRTGGSEVDPRRRMSVAGRHGRRRPHIANAFVYTPAGLSELPTHQGTACSSQIAPAFVGICGTDLHEYLGGPNFCPATRHPVTGETIPVTLGHEFSGVIKEIGSEVEVGAQGGNIRLGQPCAVQPTVYCGRCAACAAGAENVCHVGGFVGLSGGGGGLSGAVSVPADQVFPLPEGIPLELGALVEPLAVAWHAVSAAGNEITPESAVLVMGGGPIGLAVVLCLIARGVEQIIVAEVAAARQRFAKEFGATHVVDPKEQDVVKETLALTGGVGADVVFDCAGVPASIKAACHAVRTRGTVVNVAIWEEEIPFNPNWVTWKECSFRSVLGYQKADYEAVIENLRTGALRPESMITRKIPLDNLIEKGIKALITDKDNQVKILVDLTTNIGKSS